MCDLMAIRRLIDLRIAERDSRLCFFEEQTGSCGTLFETKREIAESISGRVPPVNSRPPDLHAANLSFAARILLAVREKFNGDAPKVYTAAGVSRQVYSQIVSDETKPVQKRTVIRLAFGLRSSLYEAELLLKSAGYAFSNSQTEDFILQACLEANPPCWDFKTVNVLLREYGVDYQY